MKKANSKKEVHKATYKPIYIKAIYTAVVALSLLLLIPFIYPVPIYVPFIGPALNKIVQEGNIGTITFTKPLNPDTRHYITLTLTATNKGNVEFPKGIASIIWKDKSYDPLYREKFEIYIDGISHNYYIPIGENLYWNKTKNVTQVKLELPHVEGIDITIESFSVNKRVLFPLDTYLNLYLKKYLDIDYINRFLTPSYLIFIFILVSYFIYSIYFKRVSFKALFKRALFKREASPKREDKRVGEGKENKINLKNLKINPIGISSLLLLLLFSFYFLSSQYYTLRAYYYSYKNYIK
ncbi:MAG: hypothetical protein H5T85_08910 [Actinobacteria bacterium]|nr:hypothetical protein [Actinomycetota bacterium]